MCDNCEPWIDVCIEDECGKPSKGVFVKGKFFYPGDEYCRHLQEEHGHRYAEWSDV